MSGKKGAPAPAAAPAAAATPSSYKPLPLWQRKLDLLIVFWFIVFPFTTTFTDLHNFIASAKGVSSGHRWWEARARRDRGSCGGPPSGASRGRGTAGMQAERRRWRRQCARRLARLPTRCAVRPALTLPFPLPHTPAQVPTEALEHMDLPYPPKVLTDIYFKWGRTVDPLLFLNPMWWQCIEWINLLCLTPFSFAAIYGFWAGADWVRVPAIVISSFTPYSLVLCMGSTMCVLQWRRVKERGGLGVVVTTM